MYYELLQRNKRRIILVSTLIFTLFTIIVTITLLGRIGKIPVTVSVVPKDAKILINDRSYGNGTHWLKADTYTVKASKEGFESGEKSMTVTDEKSDNVVPLSLTPSSDEAKEWAKKHQDEYYNNEKYGAIAAAAEGKYFADKNPITKKLPYKNPYYTIGYKTNKSSTITLTIVTPSPRYRFYAVEQIREWGYDPTNFTIEFQDFKNPLESV